MCTYLTQDVKGTFPRQRCFKKLKKGILKKCKNLRILGLTNLNMERMFLVQFVRAFQNRNGYFRFFKTLCFKMFYLQ